MAWTAEGEWLKYRVRVEQSGLYQASVRVASGDITGALHLELDDVALSSPPLAVPNTGGFQEWQTLNVSSAPFRIGAIDEVKAKFLITRFTYNKAPTTYKRCSS